MAIPTTIFEIVDNSQIRPVQIGQNNAPKFMQAFFSPQGPHKLGVYNASNFNKTFGVDNGKYGREFTVANNIIAGGGEVIAYRIKPSTGKLANFTIGTTVSADPAALVNNKVVSTVDVTSADVGITTIPTLPKGLISIAALGAGTYENMDISITINKQLTKQVQLPVYRMIVNVDNTTVEFLDFALISGTVVSGEKFDAMSVINRKSNYVKAFQCAGINTAYQSAATALAITLKEAQKLDLIFGTDYITNNSKVSSTTVGTSITKKMSECSGSIGNFQEASMYDSSVTTSAYTTSLYNFYSGTDTNAVYNVDKYQVDCILDSGTNVNIKKAMTSLAEFRKDCLAVLDLGITIRTIQEAKNVAGSLTNSPFAAWYGQTVTTKKMVNQVEEVTVNPITVYLANILPGFILAGRDRPFEGIRYGVQIPGLTPEQMNFIPVITPNGNEKEELSDYLINYGVFYNGQFVLETQNTCQSVLSQFSFINNILTIQSLVKAIRIKCPSIRYTFMDGEDFDNYKADIQSVISRYVDVFKTIEFEYLQDPQMEANHIFYAAINVTFRNFVESEYFILEVINPK